MNPRPRKVTPVFPLSPLEGALAALHLAGLCAALYLWNRSRSALNLLLVLCSLALPVIGPVISLLLGLRRFKASRSAGCAGRAEHG